MLSQLCVHHKAFTHLPQSPDCSSSRTGGSRQRSLERRAQRIGQSHHLHVPSHLRPPPDLSTRSLPQAHIPRENQSQSHRCRHCLI